MFSQSVGALGTTSSARVGLLAGGSLGAEVGPAATASAISSNLPAGAKASKAASKIRKLSNDKVDAAWKKLVEEAACQKLVWGSVVMNRAKNRTGEIAMLQTSLDALLEAYQSGDTDRGLVLAGRLQEFGGTDSLLGLATQTAAGDLLKQCGLVPRREGLAERLDVATVAASLPRTPEDKREVEADVVACELGDDGLERQVRQLLLLPPMVGQEDVKKPASSDDFRHVVYTGSRTLQQLVSTATPARPTQSLATAHFVDVGGYQTKPTPVKKTNSIRGGHSIDTLLAATPVTGPSASICSTAPAELDASTAPSQLRNYAAKMVEESWDKLQAEFEVAQLVWQSVLFTKFNPEDKRMFQAATEEVRLILSHVLSIKDTDVERALADLELLLPSGDKPTDVVGLALVSAMRLVLKQYQLGQLRGELAVRLADSHVAAALPRGEEEKKAMEDFIVRCEIGSRSLARAARSLLLLLPVPAELGAPASAKLSSKGPAATGKPSASTGAVRKESRKLAPTPSNKPSALPVAPTNPQFYSPQPRGTAPYAVKESI